jgi:hypothetical protein
MDAEQGTSVRDPHQLAADDADPALLAGRVAIATNMRTSDTPLHAFASAAKPRVSALT